MGTLLVFILFLNSKDKLGTESKSDCFTKPKPSHYFDYGKTLWRSRKIGNAISIRFL